MKDLSAAHTCKVVDYRCQSHGRKLTINSIMRYNAPCKSFKSRAQKLPKPRRSRQNPLVREFILKNVEEFPDSIAREAATQFGLSRTAINRYLRRLVDEGILIATGRTTARTYKLKNFVDILFTLEDVTPSLSEDVVWRFRILPSIRDVPRNVVDICQYGFTEMLNNVIDHSLSSDVLISFIQSYTKIHIVIADSGIGIFQKIQNDFGLPDPRSALLELSKGKLTSDQKRHTGEGIFFTSRMFDAFSIQSGGLYYSRKRTEENEWLIETDDLYESEKGTRVLMEISVDADWTMTQIFSKFEGDNMRFRKTHVPIKLGNYPGEQLVSRSQAKRVLARFDQFSEVFLDFEGVEAIGQAFADEIFRVFHKDHPGIKIVAIRTEPNVRKSIEGVIEDLNHDDQYSLIF